MRQHTAAWPTLLTRGVLATPLQWWGSWGDQKWSALSNLVQRL